MKPTSFRLSLFTEDATGATYAPVKDFWQKKAEAIGVYALSLVRPLALLALMIRRPPTVDILFLNPWVLALLMRLG